jgi:D-hexose-6-phosphate mutarotase
MGFPDAVVWNIGSERAGGLKDLGAGEWENYVCCERDGIRTQGRVL